MNYIFCASLLKQSRRLSMLVLFSL